MRHKDHIQALKHATSMDEAFEIIKDFGVRRSLPFYLFTQIGTHGSPSVFRVNEVYTNYPSEWVDIYKNSRYFYIDPIAKAVISNEMPFFWSEHINAAPESLSEESIAMMTHATGYGLVDGVGASYQKNKGYLCTLTMATDRPFEDYDRQLLAEAYLLGATLTHVHHKLRIESESHTLLTDRERQIVNMGAMGKTDSEIAQIANISINTVRYHWKNIFEKLQSFSKVFAIIKAMNLGYVDPHLLELTTDSGSIEIYEKGV